MPKFSPENTPKTQKQPKQEFRSSEATATPTSTTIAEVVVSTKDLPSKGLSYPENAHIKYRSFKMGELKKIAASKLDDYEAFQMILECISCNFDKKKITIGDFYYIALLIKISSLGESKFLIPHECPGCNEKANYPIDTMKDFEFNDLQIPALPIIVNTSAGELHFNPLTVEGILHLQTLGKSRDITAVFAAQCTNMEFEKAYELIDNLTGTDIKVLNKVDTYLFHGLKPLKIQCKKCGHEILVELDGGQALILPFRGSEEHLESRISFGSSSAPKSN